MVSLLDKWLKWLNNHHLLIFAWLTNEFIKLVSAQLGFSSKHVLSRRNKSINKEMAVNLLRSRPAERSAESAYFHAAAQNPAMWGAARHEDRWDLPSGWVAWGREAWMPVEKWFLSGSALDHL